MTASESEQPASSTKAASLEVNKSFNLYNLANALGYAANTLIVFGFGTFGWAGSASQGELSEKYQTIITPSGWAFSIWGPIYILQFLWVLWQLLPSQRNSPGVTTAAFWYVGACLAQVGWQLSFSYEVMWLSLIFMYAILACLAMLHIRLQRYQKIWKGYFLWQFPFSLHMGWIIAASILNTNLVMVTYGASATAQYAAGIASLVLVVLVALAFLSRYPVDFTPPLVAIWAMCGIYSELLSPVQLITDTFTQEQIDGIQTGSLVVLSLVAVFVAIKFAYVVLVQRRRQPPAAASSHHVTGDVEEGGVKEQQENNSEKLSSSDGEEVTDVPLEGAP